MLETHGFTGEPICGSNLGNEATNCLVAPPSDDEIKEYSDNQEIENRDFPQKKGLSIAICFS